MIFQHNRVASSFCFGMALLSFGLISSCKTNPPPDSRDELVRSLKGADVNGYLFATKEEDNQIITSLTNGALRDPIKLDTTHSVVIGYANVKDKKTNAVKTLKAEIIKTGSTIALQVTDLGSGLPTKFDYPPPPSCAPDPTFNTAQDCFDDYNCRIFPGLLREANSDCKIRLFDLDCCLKDGTRFAALMIIRPTRRTCLVAFPFDVDTLTLSP
jgi:hypothetical protein